jgi:hypothetical protein
LHHVTRSGVVEEEVNRVLIKCPTTGKLIYTGYALDAASFAALPIEEMDPIECPACHQTHRWQKRDAILERELPTDRSTTG